MVQCGEVRRQKHEWANGKCSLCAIPKQGTKDRWIYNFFKYVKKRPDGCWMWVGFVNPVTKRAQASWPGHKPLYASQVSWIIAGRELPKGKSMVLAHRCDVPLCVNPDHLQVQRQRDNLHDSIRWHGYFTAKLKVDDVKKIRRSSESDAALAKRYGVSIATIYRAKKGLTFRVLLDPALR